jgi:hypothetical protein
MGKQTFTLASRLFLLSVCLLHSGAISSPFLFLSVPQGVVWLLPSGSPRDTGVPWLLPQPLTEPTTRNMDAGDEEPKVPWSLGGIEEQIPIGKHPRHNFPTLFFLDASMCSFLLFLLFFFVFLSFVSFPKTSVSVTHYYWLRLFSKTALLLQCTVLKIRYRAVPFLRPYSP